MASENSEYSAYQSYRPLYHNDIVFFPVSVRCNCKEKSDQYIIKKNFCICILCISLKKESHLDLQWQEGEYMMSESELFL